MRVVLALVTCLCLAAPCWAAQAQLRVDLDGDGKADTVVLYSGNAAVTIWVRFADGAHKPQEFRFAVDPQREDAVCRLPVRLEVEPLDYDLPAAVGYQVPGFVRSKKLYGFRVADEACDSIHFFWNHETRAMEWWRL